MAKHTYSPTSPYQRLDRENRWFPADEVLREASYEKLPPLVHKIWKNVSALSYKPDSFAGLVKNFRKYKDA